MPSSLLSIDNLPRHPMTFQGRSQWNKGAAMHVMNRITGEHSLLSGKNIIGSYIHRAMNTCS
jgi:hypothetical protein